MQLKTTTQLPDQIDLIPEPKVYAHNDPNAESSENKELDYTLGDEQLSWILCHSWR